MNNYSWNLDRIFTDKQFDDIMTRLPSKKNINKREIINYYHFCNLKLYLHCKNKRYQEYKHKLIELFPFLANNTHNTLKEYIEILNKCENGNVKYRNEIFNYNPSIYSKVMNSKERLLKKLVFNDFLDRLKSKSDKLINDFMIIKKNHKNGVLTNHLLFETLNKSISSFNNLFDYRKKELGVKNIYLYDVFYNYNKKISVNKAVDIIKKSLRSLNIDNEINDIFINNRIDLIPKENKEKGYLTINMYDYHSHILFNYNYTYKDILLLSHEIGHYMSYELRRNNKTYEEMAKFKDLEIPSLTFELLTAYYIYSENKNKSSLKNILNIFLNVFYRYGIFAVFESKIYDEKKCYDEIYLNLIKEYYRSLSINDNQRYEFLGIRQLLKEEYCYQYANSIVIALAIVKKIISVKNYSGVFIDFLINAPYYDEANIEKYLNIKVNSNKLYNDFLNEVNKLINELKEIDK